MPPAKKAAPKLGPSTPPSNQPPWAMASPDSQIYLPQSADDARRFATQYGAVPINPDLWPWPNEVPIGELKTDDPKATTPSEQPPSDDAPAGPTGGPTSVPTTPGAELEPAQPAAAVPEALEGELVSGCPTPDVCWPLGLPDNCSYVTCVHGGWAVGRIGD